MKREHALSDSLSRILTICIQNNIPFFVYRLPGSQQLVCGIQKDPEVLEWEEKDGIPLGKGFVMSPFDESGKHPSFFLRADISADSGEISKEQMNWLEDTYFEVEGVEEIALESSPKEYFEQIQELIGELKLGRLRKAILSRIHLHKGLSRDDSSEVFKALTESYSHAFLFLVHVPGKVTWLGASPEILLQKKDKQLQTMALAGTQIAQDKCLKDVVWGEKEIEEQAFVSEYIEHLLKERKLFNVNAEGPYTFQAGNVLHLKTDYFIDDLDEKSKVNQLLNDLHPTPAVCGLPKQEAHQMIRKLEFHDREYYSGFLGPVQESGDFSLFVNLRSMKMMKDQIALYVGGGITAESDPEKEWEETCMKAETLLKVIRSMQE